MCSLTWVLIDNLGGKKRKVEASNSSYPRSLSAGLIRTMTSESLDWITELDAWCKYHQSCCCWWWWCCWWWRWRWLAPCRHPAGCGSDHFISACLMHVWSTSPCDCRLQPLISRWADKEQNVKTAEISVGEDRNLPCLQNKSVRIWHLLHFLCNLSHTLTRAHCSGLRWTPTCL